MTASQSGRSPLARLVLFIACLAVIACISAGLSSTGPLQQNENGQAPENGVIGPAWDYCKLVSSGPANFGVVCRNKGGTAQECQKTYTCVNTVCPDKNDWPYDGDSPRWEKSYSALLLKKCGVTV